MCPLSAPSSTLGSSSGGYPLPFPPLPDSDLLRLDSLRFVPVGEILRLQKVLRAYSLIQAPVGILLPQRLGPTALGGGPT